MRANSVRVTTGMVTGSFADFNFRNETAFLRQTMKISPIDGMIYHINYVISYYNKRNTHFDVQGLLLQFWMEHRETWQEYGEAYGA